MSKSTISERKLNEILKKAFGPTASVEKEFSNGFNNRVYLVQNATIKGTSDLTKGVIRICSGDGSRKFKSAKVLSKTTHVASYLSKGKVGSEGGVWMSMKYFDGIDIFEALRSADSETQKSLANQLFEEQNRATLAMSINDIRPGYGMSSCITDNPHPAQSWTRALLELSPDKTNASAEQQKLIKDVETRIRRSKKKLDATPAEGFLWDIGDRNVLVKNDKVIAIVDQDTVFFGDRLWAVAFADVCNQSRAGSGNVFIKTWKRLEKQIYPPSPLSFDCRYLLYKLSAALFLWRIITFSSEKCGINLSDIEGLCEKMMKSNK